jgi:hypothetical protein
MSTPRLIRDLHTMSSAKAAPDSLKDCECKKMALHEPLQFHMHQKQRYGATSSCMALWYAQGFSHSRETCPRSNREERKFLVYKESYESYACCAEIMKLGYSGTFADKRNKLQQLQSLLTEITGTSGHTGTSRKSNEIPMSLWLKPVLRAQPPCEPTSGLCRSKLRKPQMRH